MGQVVGGLAQAAELPQGAVLQQVHGGGIVRQGVGGGRRPLGLENLVQLVHLLGVETSALEVIRSRTASGRRMVQGLVCWKGALPATERMGWMRLLPLPGAIFSSTGLK